MNFSQYKTKRLFTANHLLGLIGMVFYTASCSFEPGGLPATDTPIPQPSATAMLFPTFPPSHTPTFTWTASPTRTPSPVPTDTQTPEPTFTPLPETAVALTEAAIPSTPVVGLGRPNQILFVSNRSGQPKIYVINEDGTQERSIIVGGTFQTGPSWSPDRTQIAFASGGNPTVDIFIFDIATNTVRRITSGPGTKKDPTWSPAGDQISYLQQDNDGNGVVTNLRLIKPDGSNDHILVGDIGNLTGPATWSPDSRRLAFTRDTGSKIEIHVINADGSNEVNLTPDKDSWGPDWSPDGQTILFVSDAMDPYALYTMNPDGTDVKKLLDFDKPQFNADWSPDGSRVVFSVIEDLLISYDLYIVNRDGSGLFKIIEQPSANYAADW